MEDKVILVSFVCADLTHHQLSISSDENVLFFLVLGEHLSHGKFMSDFWTERKRAERFSSICYFSVALTSK